MDTDETPAMPVARDAITHFIEETLRTGASKEDVRRILDLRIITLISNEVEGEAPVDDIRTSLDSYVRTVNVLTATEVEIIDFSEPGTSAT